MANLTPFAESLWTAATPVRFAGVWFPHVMTIVRLESGGLLLHSPCRPSERLFAEIAELGEVRYVVAPNWFHDLYLREYRRAYPSASFWGPRFLQRQRGEGFIDRVIDAGTPWFSEMPHVTLGGWLTFNESIFYHRRSRTLIVADLLSNVRADSATRPYTRFIYRLFGVDGKVALFPYLRLDLTSRSALRNAGRHVRIWDVDRLIVGHGKPIDRDAGEHVRTALR